MSLFKCRNWWATVAGAEETFDIGGLCLASLDGAPNENDVLVVGSFNGILRMYAPNPTKEESGWSGYKATDMIVETDLGAPIIQVLSGKFVSEASRQQLAILHPRKLIVVQLSCVKGAVQHGAQYQVKVAFEHKLPRSSFNMCHGSFGQSEGRDLLCVQSLDGTLSVYDQESFSFSRFLPGALLPGPLLYVTQTDSFLTASSSRLLESYKYQVLAVAADVKTKEDAANMKYGKKVVYDWSLNLGENAVDVQLITQGKEQTVFVLGERSVFCVTVFGKLKFIKKLEFSPSCLCVYGQNRDGEVQYMVGSSTCSLMIFSNTTLKWASQLQYAPVHLLVTNFVSLRGVLVSLGEEGQVGCHYLGTDPAMMVLPKPEMKEYNMQQQADKLRKLQKTIKEKASKVRTVLPTSKADDADVKLTLTVPSELDQVSRAQTVGMGSEDQVPSITVKVTLKARTLVSNVSLVVDVEDPLFAEKPSHNYSSVSSQDALEIDIPIYLKFNMLPSTITVKACVSYETSSGSPRVIQSVQSLPISLVLAPAPPTKSAKYKVTIDTNRAPVNLNKMFPDLLGMNAGGPGAALGFQFYGGPVVTILASQTSQRYRIQCDSFPAMWLLAREVHSRLKGHHGKNSGFEASFSGPLPLDEYFEVIDQHFEHRIHGARYKELLEQKACQFRAVQQRLLTKFKDKTPSPLSNLDTILEGTYRQMLALADGCEENQRASRWAGHNLSSASRLLAFLARLSFKLTDKEEAILQGALCAEKSGLGSEVAGEVGQEENILLGVTHLLRTCLARSAKDSAVVAPSDVSLPDTGKTKRHVSMVFERLGKGSRLYLSEAEAEAVQTAAAQQSTKGGSSKNKGSSRSGAGAGGKKSKGVSLTSRNLKLGPSVSESADQLEERDDGDGTSTPPGSRFGEKSPRGGGKKLESLARGGGNRLESLGISGGPNPPPALDTSKLPPLTGGGQSSRREEVPDLDDLINGSSFYDDDDAVPV